MRRSTTATDRGTVPPLRSRGAFWGVAYSQAIVLVGANLPTPLYVVYQERMGFGNGVLTLVFAAYVAAVLLVLPLARGSRIGQGGARY